LFRCTSSPHMWFACVSCLTHANTCSSHACARPPYSQLSSLVPIYKARSSYCFSNGQLILSIGFVTYIWVFTYKLSSSPSLLLKPKVLLSCQITFFFSPSLTCVDELVFSSPYFSVLLDLKSVLKTIVSSRNNVHLELRMVLRV